MSLDRVLTALYGPRCASCGRRRTTNPSKTCGPCLERAGQLCRACKGTGQRRRRLGEWAEGCGDCDGTGVRGRA